MHKESINALNRIAELLPEENRQRFFEMITRLRNVPEDDEYLLILEAIGFMTLIWHEVPNQVQTVLASGAPSDANTNNAFLVSEIRKAVKAELNVPTYTDMRQIAARFEEQHGILKNTTAQLLNRFEKLSPAPTKPISSTCAHPLLWLIAGVILVLCIQNFVLPNVQTEALLDLIPTILGSDLP